MSYFVEGTTCDMGRVEKEFEGENALLNACLKAQNIEEDGGSATVTDEDGNVIDHCSTNVGIIQGGGKINQVPDSASCSVDVRLPYGCKHEEVVAAVDALIAKSGVEGVEASVNLASERARVRYRPGIVSHAR